MITAQDLVHREVHYCVSSLVSTLAQACDFDDSKLDDLCYQAFMLTTHVTEYEEAAQEAGWNYSDDHGAFFHDDGRSFIASHDDADWQQLCDEYDIEPYGREVYEHWIVSDWLADKLIEKGEKVDKDFAGLIIWARTTTGQAIYCDGVIEQITEEVNKA